MHKLLCMITMMKDGWLIFSNTRVKSLKAWILTVQAPKEAEPYHDRPDFQPELRPSTYAEWKVGGFLVPVIFSVLFIIFDFLCRSGAGMDGVLVQEP